ncbi:WD domain-containing protein [Histoplasma capsulatum G186AR]|uniref:WD domain-containing protein n=2 Tax=Ajellomyces capsulatus TaxID=5037 RepID=C0NBX7_AJECG|nr:WD domain-containing protein [Histoplasma capsulatum G186AR]EEH11168.1 WD domain-containing protein [Histoplasma capsulatum G186AR]KAG5302986.1 WD domain-containing protein [Histoplasma capsulatum]QSS71614.1 WD domain-containing protein [Histoplasma capsulatum G186AR]
MVKSYLKFEPSKTFGVITAASSNAVWIPDEDVSAETRHTGAGRAVVGAGEEVICWDVKKGELLSRWRDSDCSAQVTAISQSKTDQDIFAVGYEDGSIRLWDSRLATVMISFNGHKTAITQLAFDGAGVRLASGSKDTDIIVWDLIAEVGIVKLRGHTDQITSVNFLDGSSISDTEVQSSNSQDRFLLSTGKDSLIKIWDLSSQHCIETHVAQSNGECWSLGLSPDQSGCITGGNDGELRVWSIDATVMNEVAKETGAADGRKILVDRGNLYRQGKDRTMGIHFHPRLDYVAVHGAEKSIEIWRIRTEAEIQKSLARKRKRRREKAGEQGAGHELENGADAENPDSISAAPISEVFVSYTIVRIQGKIRSADWMGGKGLRMLAATSNNQLEVYGVVAVERQKSKSSEDSEYNRILSIDMPGHRTDVRSLALSSDDRMLSSASNGTLKIWNVRTQTCLRTLECGYSLCSAFLPGDKIVVLGNKNGELEVFDIASATLLDTIQAHEGPVWALHVHPDGKSMVTGSADKTAKFWEFKVVQEAILGTKRTTPRLKLVHTRTLKVNDDILSIRFSPDARLIAVALLDNTVKVFFVDTLKLFLILYGHKLPVLNMDISYDSKLIVTCSADKNVRLWGLDFGDCHKAFFAHQDSIMAVAFIPNNNEGNGHHFFSASKDRVIKYWDGDKFEQIQKLEGHHGEIWSLAVSHSGEFIVTASHDKSIRVWEQTDEQIFLEEERERELEELYDSTLATSLDKEDEDAEGQEKAEAAAASKQTITTLMAGEKIVEALDLGIEDLALMREWTELKSTNPKTAPPSRNPVYLALGNISAERHVLQVIQKIPAAALQDALLVLPFSKLPALFTFLNIWAKNAWEIPLTCRVLFFMLRTHHRQIVASKMMRPMLDGIRGNLRNVLARQKDEMGFNIAALKFIGNQVRERGRSNYIDENLWEKEEQQVKGSKKRYFVNVS